MTARRRRMKRPVPLRQVLEHVVERMDEMVGRVEAMHLKQLEFLKETRENTERTLSREFATVHGLIKDLRTDVDDLKRPRSIVPQAPIPAPLPSPDLPEPAGDAPPAGA